MFPGVLVWGMTLPKDTAPLELRSKVISEAVSKHQRLNFIAGDEMK